METLWPNFLALAAFTLIVVSLACGVSENNSVEQNEHIHEIADWNRLAALVTFAGPVRAQIGPPSANQSNT